jgi:hypothetical protein
MTDHAGDDPSLSSIPMTAVRAIQTNRFCEQVSEPTEDGKESMREPFCTALLIPDRDASDVRVGFVHAT